MPVKTNKQIYRQPLFHSGKKPWFRRFSQIIPLKLTTWCENLLAEGAALTPPTLHFAAEHGYIRMVQKLIEAKAEAALVILSQKP